MKDIKKTDDAFYIPILESLQQLIDDDSILEEVNNTVCVSVCKTVCVPVEL